MKIVKHSIKASLLAVLLPIAFASQSIADNRVFSKDKEHSTDRRTGSSARDQKSEDRDKKRGYKNKPSQKELKELIEKNLTEEQKHLILLN